jgi:hypothetical protein
MYIDEKRSKCSQENEKEKKKRQKKEITKIYLHLFCEYQ